MKRPRITGKKVASCKKEMVAVVGCHGHKSYFRPGDRLYDQYKEYAREMYVVDGEFVDDEDYSSDHTLIHVVMTKKQFDEHNMNMHILNALELYYPNDSQYFKSRRYQATSSYLNRLMLSNIMKKALARC